MMKNILMLIIGALLVFIVVLCILTPDKTESGEYTDAVKYWTDDVYFYSNFNSQNN